MMRDPNSPETLAAISNELAPALVAALAADGIKATMTDGFPSCWKATRKIHVIVKQADFARASEILAHFEEGAADVNWSQVDVGEPEDG